MKSSVVQLGMVGLITLLSVVGGMPAAAQMAGVGAGMSQQVSGSIAAIDAQRGALKLQGPVASSQPGGSTPQPTIFLVDDHTIISKGPQRLQLADLKVGDAVQVEYALEAGRHMARTVHVQESTPGAATPAGPSSPQSPTGQ